MGGSLTEHPLGKHKVLLPNQLGKAIHEQPRLTVPGLQKMRNDVEDELILVMVVLVALPVQADVWDYRFKRIIFVKYIKKDL